MKIFFQKDLKEIQKEKKNKNYAKQIQNSKRENTSLKKELKLTQETVNDYAKQIQDLKNENTSLKKELELTQGAVNDLIFNNLGGE